MKISYGKRDKQYRIIMLSDNKLDKISSIEIDMHIPHNKLLALHGYFHAL